MTCKVMMLMMGIVGSLIVSACAPTTPGPEQDTPPAAQQPADEESPAEQPRLVIETGGHQSRVNEVLFTPNGQQMVSISYDKTIRVWDVESGELLKTIRGQIGEGQEGTLRAAALSPDGKLLVVGGWLSYRNDGEYGRIRLIDLETGKQSRTLQSPSSGAIDTLAFSPDGQWLASGGSNDTVELWDICSENLNAEAIPVTPIATLTGHKDNVRDLTFAPDSKQIVSASRVGTLRLWTIPEGLAEAKHSGFEKPVTSKILQQHDTVVHAVAFASNGRYIASGDAEGHVLLWDHEGILLEEQPIKPPPGIIATMAFAPDSQYLLVGGTGLPKVNIFRLPDGKQLIGFSKHSNTVLTSAFYSLEQIATADFNGHIYLWDALNETVKHHLHGQGQAVWTVGMQQDDTPRIAFGHTRGGANGNGPLEQVFDFKALRLGPQPSSSQNFRKAQTEIGNTLLHKISGYELRLEQPGNAKIMIKRTEYDGRIWAYTLTPQKQVIVGGSYSLKGYAPDGTQLREFVGHIAAIQAVAVSADGTLLVSGSADKTLKLWSLEEMSEQVRPLATLFVADDGEWICWTPQGYYAASAGGEKYIGWHLNQGVDKSAKYFPAYVFRQQFHRPELVKRTIALRDFAAAKAAIEADTGRPVTPVQIRDILPPTVTWIQPQADLDTDQPTVPLRAEIRSEYEITEVKVLVNGRPADTSRGLVRRPDDTPRRRVLEMDIPLTEGRNEISIYAANHHSGATSAVRTVQYTPIRLMKPDLYMVSIGISDYDDASLRLRYADDDAKAMSALFQAQEGALYDSVTIRELYDADATRSNIIKAFTWLSKETTQKDVAVVFIAAHGQNSDQGKYYILPADGRFNALLETGVSWGVFAEILGNLPSRVALFLDTCHSGQLGQDLTALVRGAQVDNTEAIRELGSDEYGVVILSASTGSEFSREHADWGHGAFTRALLDGLKEARAEFSGDGIIHLHELQPYLYDRVKALTDGAQHPTVLLPSTISRFPLIQVEDEENTDGEE